jgi:hypothetical protein
MLRRLRHAIDVPTAAIRTVTIANAITTLRVKWSADRAGRLTAGVAVAGGGRGVPGIAVWCGRAVGDGRWWRCGE